MRLGCVLLIAMAASACAEEVGSENIRTGGIYADFEVVAEGDGSSELEMALRVGGNNSNTYIRLGDGDELYVEIDGDERSVRTREGVGNRVYYVASADVDAEDTLVFVSLERDEDEDAPSSRVRLPPPFELEGVETGERISREDDLEVTWEPDDDGDFETTWELDGDCLFIERGDAEDGELRLRASDFDLSDEDEDPTCDATLTVERTRRGRVDEAYGEGGRFYAIQRRSVRFRTVP